jgi:hypothetical protein
MSLEDFGYLAGHCDGCGAPVDYCLCGCECGDDVSTPAPCPSCHTKGE